MKQIHSMKQIRKSILLFITVISTISSLAQTSQGFKISGHIEGLDNNDIIKLGNRFADWHKVSWMDSCKIEDGNFRLTVANVPEGPRIYEIWFYKANGKALINDGDFDYKRLFIQNGDNIKIEGSINNFKQIKITGSPTIESYKWEQAVLEYADGYRSRITHRLAKIHDSIGFDYSAVEKQVGAKRVLAGYIDSVTRNVSADNLQAVPMLLSDLNELMDGYHGEFIKNLYEKLPMSLKNSYYGKEIGNSTLLAIGQPFPDFTLPAADGSKIVLSSLARKSKLTLVHFWASNSFNVQFYQHELKGMYKKYGNKGLNIIGVSADTSAQKWKDWMDLENYPWVNVIAEPKGWQKGSLINDVYNEGSHSIPNTTNVLVDNGGRIVAWDVEGVELQYYLEKYLGN